MHLSDTYRDRPDTLKLVLEIELNGRKGRRHNLNQYEITIWEDGEVTAQRNRYYSKEPGKFFENMTVSDGEINLPIEDLVEFILMRIKPDELAEGIMSDDDARRALVYKMAERHSSPTFMDKDRREFLTKVQCQIVAVALDRAIEKLNKLEETNRAKSDYFRWKAVEIGCYKGLYEYTERLLEGDEGRMTAFKQRHMSPEVLGSDIKEGRDPVVTQSTGPQWHESRDYWRQWLKDQIGPVE